MQSPSSSQLTDATDLPTGEDADRTSPPASISASIPVGSDRPRNWTRFAGTSAESPIAFEGDALVIGLAVSADGRLTLVPGAAEIEGALGGRLLPALSDLGATGEIGDVVLLASLGAVTAPIVAAVGLGAERSAYTPDASRTAAAAATRALAGRRRIGLALDASSVDLPGALEGALLAGYTFDRYRTTSRSARDQPVREVVLLGDQDGSALLRVVVAADAVRLARDLVNVPAGDLHPADLATVAEIESRLVGLEVEIWDEERLRTGGFGGLTGVGQGAANPPRLVAIRHRPARSRGHVALIGKGITFDSGGLSLKPAASMEAMKVDMSGAAAVLATMIAVARLDVDVTVTGWLACAENMPDGGAIRPGDVLHLRAGTTVEVLNTDAEGRLVLADALAMASADDPDVMVDVATLTGAAVVALGSRVAGVMGNDEALRNKIVTLAERAGEAMWPMPLPDELRKSLDSEIADIANTGDRNGGMLVAGLFLQDFVPASIPWAHLDIAGPAWNSGVASGPTPKGGTGAGVRTLIALVEDMGDVATPPAHA